MRHPIIFLIVILAIAIVLGALAVVYLNIPQQISTSVSSGNTSTPAKNGITIDSVFCTLLQKGNTYADGTTEYVFTVSASGTATADIGNEFSPSIFTNSAIVQKDESGKIVTISWSGFDSSYNSFRRENKDLSTTDWKMSEDITIVYGSTDAWPEIQVQGQLISYTGDNNPRMNIGTVQKPVRCQI